VTIVYKKDELIPLMQWVYDNQDIIGGMAFLPSDDTIYQQAPNEDLTEEEYLEMVASFPDIDFSQIYAFEEQDETTSAMELACSAGQCDIL